MLSIGVRKMEIRKGAKEHIDNIVELAKTEFESVGFLPKSVYERAVSLDRRPCEKLDVCFDNGKLVGYCYSTRNNGTVKIQQVLVENESRRKGYASALVDAAVCNYDYLIKLRCAVDSVEGNAFCEGLSFELIKMAKGGKSRDRWIKVYGKPVIDCVQLSLF